MYLKVLPKGCDDTIEGDVFAAIVSEFLDSKNFGLDWDESLYISNSSTLDYPNITAFVNDVRENAIRLSKEEKTIQSKAIAELGKLLSSSEFETFKRKRINEISKTILAAIYEDNKPRYH